MQVRYNLLKHPFSEIGRLVEFLLSKTDINFTFTDFSRLLLVGQGKIC